jgi:hypothetical protein
MISTLPLELDKYPMPEQDENGIEISHLRENLKLTPAQRLARAESMINEIMQLRRKMRPAPHGR